MNDKVNNPKHYTSHPSGIECIQITEHYNFCMGNAIKYLWRQGLKEESGYDTLEKQVEDCKKAIWYINRHIESLTKGMDKPLTNKEKVDLLNNAVKSAEKLYNQVDNAFKNTEVQEKLPLEKQFTRDLAEMTIKPGQAKAGGAWMLDREASARALISSVESKNSWLDCND